jgi:RNA-directed DNA polymerase
MAKAFVEPVNGRKQMNENADSSCALPHSTDNWDLIQWKKVIQRVNRLQRRIAKAIKENRWGKAKALMYLVSKSFYAKLLAVFRVTANKGKNTPGVDNFIWINGYDKLIAAKNLKTRGYSCKPLRRIYIPKKNGKKRPLSIPCMDDRAIQALFLIALAPVAETTADKNSFGFREKRSCADAIAQCFNILSRKNCAQWILEADIKACFDQINHKWILRNCPVNKTILNKWLKAGYIEKGKLFPTNKGTPQGGIVSPVIMNMVLDGLETLINRKFPRWKKLKVNFVRYADDFIITAKDKAIITEQIIPLVKDFLKERGLELSDEKSKITHIDQGFNFLSQNVRKYKGKLLIKPSRKSVQSFKDKIKTIIKDNKGIPAHDLIKILNPVIRGWANYHKGICAKDTFNKMDNFIFRKIWKWAKHQHGNKSQKWIFNRYFLNNNFSDTRVFSKGTYEYRLYKIRYVPIRYHVKILGDANPYFPEFDQYFVHRQKCRESLAKECKQITTSVHKSNKCSRVAYTKARLRSA